MSGAPRRGVLALAARVLAVELVLLARDRRALFAALVLPALLYPLLLAGNDWLEREARESEAARSVRVVYDLGALDPPQAERVRIALAGEPPIELVALEADALVEPYLRGETERELERARRQLEREGDALVLALRDAAARTHLRVYHDGSREAGNEARRRVVRALRRIVDEDRHAALAAELGGDPADAWTLEARDTASAEDAAGAWLGGLLPLFAIFVLVSGSAFAALASLAGEREAGTLETLLVQPVPARAIAIGKLGLVLVASLATLVANLASLALCARLGVGGLGGGAHAALALSGGRVLLGGLVFLPAVALVACAMAALGSRARTFREGQLLVFPATLALVLPTLPALRAEIALSPALALVPLTGPALALRDALRGTPLGFSAALAVLASSAWAALAARALARSLEAERWLVASDARESARAASGVGARRALRFGLGAALLAWLVGGPLQAERPLLGLLLTLCVGFAGSALLFARGTARRTGEGFGAALNLHRPRLAHLVGALLLAPPLALGAELLVHAQQELLPLPTRFAGELAARFPLAELDLPRLLLLFALAPGVCEELFFRGALLVPTRRELSAPRTALRLALLFALAHASLHRFLPTAAAGLVFGAVALRAHSLWPAIVVHAAYDGLLVLSTRFELHPALALLALPACLCFLPPSAVRSQARAHVPSPWRADGS